MATPHRLASEAGRDALRDGGNAIDAAVAANAVLCVVYPAMTSIGGDLFAIVWPAGEETPVGLEAAGRSGSLASWEAVRERGHETMPERGPLTITVPGTVGGWGRLVERYGSFGMGRVLGPAAALARDGFQVTENLAGYLADNAHWLLAEPEAARLLPPVKAGMTLRNADLATTLETLGRNGIGTFYWGEIGAAIADAVRRRDGFLTREDLAAYRPALVAPLALPYGDFTVYEMPPPSQGAVGLGMMERLRRLPRAAKEPGPDFARAFVDARDAVYALRDRLITDPDFFSAPLEPFFDPSFRAGERGEALPEGDTIYLCTADEHGNVVSLIQSVANSFGSGVIAEGTGVMLQNRGLYFSLDPEHVNRLEPRKRTMHTLMPALAARGGRPWAAFGNMGADGQPQFQAQVWTHLAERGLDPQEAVSHPRLRVAPGGGELWIEADYPAAAEIARGGWMATKLQVPRSSAFGHAQALVVDGPAAWRAGADPRADGSVEAGS